MSKSEIVIRPARVQDLDSVLEIEALWPTTPHWTRTHFEREIASGRNYFCVAVQGPRIVGYAALLLIPPEAQVTTVAVHPDSSGKGLGRMLMHHLHERARQAQCSVATLEVSEKNPVAIHLYEALGYRIVGRRPKYYNGIADALLMTNHLAGKNP